MTAGVFDGFSEIVSLLKDNVLGLAGVIVLLLVLLILKKRDVQQWIINLVFLVFLALSSFLVYKYFSIKSDVTIFSGNLRDSSNRAVSDALISIDGFEFSRPSRKDDGFFELPIPKQKLEGEDSVIIIARVGDRIYTKYKTTAKGADGIIMLGPIRGIVNEKSRHSKSFFISGKISNELVELIIRKSHLVWSNSNPTYQIKFVETGTKERIEQYKTWKYYSGKLAVSINGVIYVMPNIALNDYPDPGVKDIEEWINKEIQELVQSHKEAIAEFIFTILKNK